MKLGVAIALIAFGGILLAIASFTFFESQSQLQQIQGIEASFGGLGGLGLALTDSLGLTNVEQRRREIQAARGIAMGMGFIGFFLAAAGLVVLNQAKSVISGNKST